MKQQPRKRLRQPAPVADVETGESRIVQHPDGYYWLTELHEVGPFATLDDARADMEATGAGEGGIEPGETLAQAEEDIGVETWIDPETGAPAEEQRPRIEDH
jgi:hypothetical protein